MDDVSGFALASIIIIVFLACAAQAAAPVSPPESRFVWEPGENLIFTWTNENFDGFYYDPESRAGNESLTIRLDKLRNRSVQLNGIVYFKKPGLTDTRYRLSRKYAVLEFTREKYYPTNMGGTIVIPEEVAINNVSDIPDSTMPAVIIPSGTSPVAGRTEKTSGFEAVLSILIILVVYITGKRRL